MASKKPDKLAQDAAKAKAAGLSYGKWRALQEASADKTEVKPPQNMMACPHCGESFKKTHGNQRFCCSYCQKEDARERHRTEQQRQKIRDWEAKYG